MLASIQKARIMIGMVSNNAKPTGVKKMQKVTVAQMTKEIEKVADATGQTKHQVIEKLFAKDQWTWFLIGQCK
jgi:hypothetical protein